MEIIKLNDFSCFYKNKKETQYKPELVEFEQQIYKVKGCHSRTIRLLDM